MDLGASTTFVVEDAESDIMSRKPRNPHGNVLNFATFLRIFSGAFLLVACVLGAYLFGTLYVANADTATTMTYVAWLLSHCWLGFQFRTLYRPLLVVHGLFSNWMMLIWVALVLIALVLTLYVPTLQILMKLSVLDGKYVIYIFLYTVGVFFIAEIFKDIYWAYSELRNLFHKQESQQQQIELLKARALQNEFTIKTLQKLLKHD